MSNYKKNSLSRFRSFIIVIIYIAILIAVNIYYTHISFLTSDFYAWIPIFNTMVSASIIGYFILFLINNKILNIFLELITALFGVWGFYNLYKIFPFITNNDDYSLLTHAIIIFIIIGCIISSVINFIKLIINR